MKRESKAEKLNHLSYTTPHNLERYARHMKKGEKAHGRSNWKKGGYPKIEYLESMQRHLNELWAENEAGHRLTDNDPAAALRFNVEGYMHEEWLEEPEYE